MEEIGKACREDGLEIAALNRFVNVVSPNIYDLISSMKDIETFVALKYFKYKDINAPQKRRQEDVTRDYTIASYQTELTNKQCTIYGYMQKISHLFNFTDAKKITTPFSINNIINTKIKK